MVNLPQDVVKIDALLGKSPKTALNIKKGTEKIKPKIKNYDIHVGKEFHSGILILTWRIFIWCQIEYTNASFESVHI